MAAEAQRVVNISMGKFSNSKALRGGMSLRKNLLVNNVLYKARTVYMENNFSPVPLGADYGNYEDYEDYFYDNENERNLEPRDYVCDSPEDELNVTHSEESNDGINLSVSGQVSPEAKYQGGDDHCLTEKEMEWRSNSFIVPSIYTKRPAGSEFIEVIPSVLPKRQRQDIQYDCVSEDYDFTGDEDHFYGEEEELFDMDVKPISNLVTIFKSSFSELTGKDENGTIHCASQPEHSKTDVNNIPVIA